MAATITTIRPGIVRVDGAQTDLGAAMFNAVAAFAAETGMPAGNDHDIEIAARAPVSLAAAYADLCAQLGVPLPAFVRRALD